MNYKRFISYAVVMITMVFIAAFSTKKASAADAMITFSSDKSTAEVGDTINVSITINAITNIGMVDMYVAYDSSRLEFIQDVGGRFTGGAGLLHISSDESAGATDSVEYIMSFNAIASGTCSVNIADRKSVKDTAGSEMTTSSNRVSVKIGGSVTPTTYNSADALSSDNTLLSLSVSAGELKPPFKKKKTKYTLDVTNDVSELYFSYKTSEEHASVRFEGNEVLFDGKNDVKVIVTAQNGDEKVYNIEVNRESLAESKKRVADNGKKGLEFSVYEDGGFIYLQNKYRLAVVDVDESDEVPAGFKKTSVLLYGVNVTAYTVANDLDSDFLIMYCMNENGDKDFYQFDRSEKTLQKYTGDLIRRINANKNGTFSGEMITSEEYRENLNQMAVILAIIVGLCVMLIIIIISLLLKQAKSRSKRIEDQLDF